MQNIQVLRYMANIESKLNNLSVNSDSGGVDLTDINNRISSVESRLNVLESNKPNNLEMNNDLVNLADINNRIVSLETNNLNDVNRHVTLLENSLASLESNFNNFNVNELNDRLMRLESNQLSSVPSVDLSEVNNRLASLENNSTSNCNVDLTEINNRLMALETINNDLSLRLAAIETKPDLLQRLSALELTVATLNNNN